MGQPLMKMVTIQIRQRGVVLLIALIALVAMTLAGIALMRSVDTANVIAGNFAFKESTLNTSDLGTESAATTMLNTAAAGNLAAASTSGTGYVYFPVRQATDAQGLPTTVNWSTLGSIAAGNTGNSVQYVIERMCEPIPAASGVAAAPNGPVQTNRADVTDYCVTVPQCSPGISINTPPFCVAGDIYYRVTTRVQGPRGTVSVVQTMVSM